MNLVNYYVRNFDLTADVCKFTSDVCKSSVLRIRSKKDKVEIGIAHGITAIGGPLAALATAIVRVVAAPFICVAGTFGSTYNFVAGCLGKKKCRLPTLSDAFYNLAQIVKQVAVGMFILPFVGACSPNTAARLFPINDKAANQVI
ncbi:MAG: hypothetical protein ACXU9U_00125 [Parachlamydiaceae bacterium]